MSYTIPSKTDRIKIHEDELRMINNTIYHRQVSVSAANIVKNEAKAKALEKEIEDLLLLSDFHEKEIAKINSEREVAK